LVLILLDQILEAAVVVCGVLGLPFFGLNANLVLLAFLLDVSEFLG
jgi:hypothetical protein